MDEYVNLSENPVDFQNDTFSLIISPNSHSILYLKNSIYLKHNRQAINQTEFIPVSFSPFHKVNTSYRIFTHSCNLSRLVSFISSAYSFDVFL